MGLTGLLLGHCILPQSARAGVVLDKPGIYEVKGRYQRFSAGVIYLSVVEGTRSQHVVRVKKSADPRILSGVKLRILVIARSGGDPNNLVFEMGESALMVLNPDADIYSDFWRWVSDVPAEIVPIEKPTT